MLLMEQFANEIIFAYLRRRRQGESISHVA